jgi:hypothetical protein
MKPRTAEFVYLRFIVVEEERAENVIKNKLQKLKDIHDLQN